MIVIALQRHHAGGVCIGDEFGGNQIVSCDHWSKADMGEKVSVAPNENR
eukprot:SAG31_NODE_33078_length_348_cov_0.690763_1_plen_48_part_01